MTAVITWRLGHPDHDSHVRFFVMDDHVFRLMRMRGNDLEPFSNKYFSVEDAHLKAVSMTSYLERKGYQMDPSQVLYTRSVTPPDKLLRWVRNDPSKAREELAAIAMNAIMVGEVLR